MPIWSDYWILIGSLDLIGAWCGEDEIANIIKDTCLKEIGLHLQILITTLHSTMRTIGRTYSSSQEINKHALSITITTSKQVQFSIRSLHMLHRRLTVDLLTQHEFCCWKLEKMKNEPNHTHIPSLMRVLVLALKPLKVKILQHVRKSCGHGVEGLIFYLSSFLHPFNLTGFTRTYSHCRFSQV